MLHVIVDHPDRLSQAPYDGDDFIQLVRPLPQLLRQRLLSQQTTQATPERERSGVFTSQRCQT